MNSELSPPTGSRRGLVRRGNCNPRCEAAAHWRHHRDDVGQGPVNRKEPAVARIDRLAGTRRGGAGRSPSVLLQRTLDRLRNATRRWSSAGRTPSSSSIRTWIPRSPRYRDFGSAPHTRRTVEHRRPEDRDPPCLLRGVRLPGRRLPMRDDPTYFESRFRERLAKTLRTAGLRAEIFIWDDFHDRYLISNLIGISLSNGFDTKANQSTSWHRLGRNGPRRCPAGIPPPNRTSISCSRRASRSHEDMQNERTVSSRPAHLHAGTIIDALDVTMPDEHDYSTGRRSGVALHRGGRRYPAARPAGRFGTSSEIAADHRGRDREFQGNRSAGPDRPAAHHAPLRTKQHRQEHDSPRALLRARAPEPWPSRSRAGPN